MKWKEEFVNYFIALSWHLHEGTAEICEKPQPP
jgi:hypothetical protein